MSSGYVAELTALRKHLKPELPGPGVEKKEPHGSVKHDLVPTVVKSRGDPFPTATAHGRDQGGPGLQGIISECWR